MLSRHSRPAINNEVVGTIRSVHRRHPRSDPAEERIAAGAAVTASTTSEYGQFGGCLVQGSSSCYLSSVSQLAPGHYVAASSYNPPRPETSENVQRDLAPGVSSLCQPNGKRTLRTGIVGLAYLSPCANLMTWAAFLSSRNPLMRIASGNPPSPPASSAWVNGVGTQPSFFTTRPRTTSDAPFSTCDVPTKKGRTGGIFVAVVVQLAVVVVVVLALTLAHKVSGQCLVT